jgi:amino acid adenylation domain-containing protein
MSLLQQQAIRAKCLHPTGTFSAFAPEAIEQSIPDRFEHMVARHPERPAVKTGNLALTYAGLNQMANRVARAILARCGEGAEPVALLLAQGAPNIAAILGVLKAGKFYVPLDPMYPPARLSYMLEDSQAHLIVTDAQHLPVAEAGGRRKQQVLNLDELQAGFADENLGSTLGPDTLANLLYTSGSTGAPKGVLHNHRNVLHMVRNACNGFHLCAEDRLSLLYSPSVASAARTVFSALLNGATVLPYNLREAGLAGLSSWLIQEEITCYNSVATVFRHFARTLTGEEHFPSLRLIVLGSETIYKSDVELYRQHFPPTCLFVATLGATEITHIRRYFVDQEVPLPDSVVPVGYPEEGVQVLLLDESGQEVRVDAVGQIAVKSRALSLGYWHRPDLTQARFLPDPNGGDERIYLTGDLGRMHDDGCLMHVGREDFQVKIRGHRVEVGEIETALLDHPGVKEAVVIAHEDSRGEKRLAGYLVASQELTPSTSMLREFLAVKLPDYMLPTTFMFLDALPPTLSGKVDRRALPPPREEDDAPDSTWVAPRTPLESALAEMWSQVLGRTHVGIHDNFFELGGHSLIATQVVARLQATFQIELPLGRLFELPTIAELALAIEQVKDNGAELQASAIAPVSPEAYGIKRSSLRETDGRADEKGFVFPASFAQQRLWFLDQLEPESPAYNISAAYRLSGPLHVPALEQAISEIVRRHETLRTTFHAADGQPFQRVAPHRPLALPIVDLRGLPEEDNDARTLQLATEEAHRPFDLAQGPLFRATLVQLAEEQYVLLLTMHHIVSDGWSKRVLNRELTALYGAYATGQPSPLPELPIQYADFAVWQREWLQGEVLERQLSYWRQQLGGSPPMLEVPTDRPRPAIQTYRGARQSLQLPKPLSDALRALSQGEGVTLFMTLLAGFQILLHRHTDEDDLLVGSPIAGRNQVEVEGLIGFFVNTLILRTNLAGNPTFRELLGRVREGALGAYAHQDLPFEKLVEELQPERSLSHTPLFQVFFNMQNLQDSRLALPGIVSEAVSFPEAESKFDLTLYVREQLEGLRFDLVYNADLFDRPRILELLQQFRHLLGQVVAHPQASIAEYSLVTPAAQAFLPDPTMALPEPSYACVAETVLSWAERTPDQAAVCQGGQSWTYHHLAETAQLLARILLGQGMERGEVVAVTGERSFGLIASMTAVLASGGVLLTLDPNLPSHRQQLMLREAGAKHLFYVGRCRAEDEWVRQLQSVAVTWLEPDGGPMALPPELSHAEAVELPRLTPDEPAYLFFTSGTTGIPKGVLGCHKGLSHFLTWQRDTFAVGPHDRCAQLTGLSFDVVLRDVFLPLSSGASLHLPEEWDDPQSEKILAWLEEEKITLLHTVPALAQTWLMDVPEGVTLQSLRWVFFAGEPLTNSLIRRWRQAFPQVSRIVNLYGPTETTLAKCCYPVPSDPLPGVQPIGEPLPETQALVMRDSGQLCGIGEPGEIVLRTPFRSLGYVNAPAENRKRFFPNPFREDRRDLLYRTGDRGRYRADGSVEIHGRLDDQVKIRGVRVEPDEVTAVLSKHPAVKSCAVVPRTDEQGEAFLVAYVVASEQNQAMTADLRSYLSTQLPSAMLPSAFMLLDALPLTPNGKVDRWALPAPSGRHPALDAVYVAPRTPTEEILAGIWAAVLGLDRVGVEDNFFELGGHSLLATRIISRLYNAFQVAIPLRSFFEAPTLAGLAEAIEKVKDRAEQAEHDEMARLLAEVEGLPDEEIQRLLVDGRA